MKLTSLLNGILWAVVLGALAWWFHGVNERRVAERRLKEALARLSVETPAARIIVDSVVQDEATGQTVTRFQWLDTGSDWKGRPGARPRGFEVRGDEVHFQTYQIIFEPEQIREGDPLRGKSLTLFARTYGSAQAPEDGLPIHVPRDVLVSTEASESSNSNKSDAPPLVPLPFRTEGASGDLERELWSQFWDLCRAPPEERAEKGVRGAQGTAVSKPLVAGMEYRLSINNQGQIFFDGPMHPDPFIKP